MRDESILIAVVASVIIAALIIMNNVNKEYEGISVECEQAGGVVYQAYKTKPICIKPEALININ